MNKLQKAIEVKETPKKTQRWGFADVFLAIVSLAVLNAFMVYWVFSTLSYSWRIETTIAIILSIVLNMHITKMAIK